MTRAIDGNQINPPAIVHEAESVAQLMAEYKALDTDIAQAERMTLAKAVRQGKILLKIRERSEHGQYLAALQKLGVPQQRASERIRVASLPPEVLEQCDSFISAKEHCAGNKEHCAGEKTKPPHAVLSTENESSDTPPPPPSQPTIFCRPCRVSGHPKPGCKDCAAIRLRMNGTPEPSAPGEGQEEHAEEEDASDDEPTPADEADETVITDAAGVPVPEQAREAFKLSQEMEAFGTDVDALVRKAKEISERPGGRLVQFEDVKLHLRNAKLGVRQSRPTHVCPLCQGKKADCPCCKGQGWTAEHVWKRLTEEARR